MEEGLKKKTVIETVQQGKVVSQDNETLKQLSKEDAVASESEEEEVPKRDNSELNGESGKGDRVVLVEKTASDYGTTNLNSLFFFVLSTTN